MTDTIAPPTELSDRISSEYLETQRALHELPYYGVNALRWIGAVEDIIKEHDIKTVLDYGCGKGCLKAGLMHLEGVDVREYDPAIAGKDAEPEPADLLVCLDVLEHIEEDKLTSVLEHMRCHGRMMFCVVCTTPAIKTLPDGRNAHINLHDGDWWKNTLSMNWDIQDWVVRDGDGKGECIGLMKPFVIIGEIKGVGAVANDVRNENTRINIAVTTKRLQPAKFKRWNGPDSQQPLAGHRIGLTATESQWLIPKPHDGVAIVMCYGPSIADTWQEAVYQRENIARSVIISVSGAHDWLTDKGIVPDYHVECDPRLHKGDMLQKPNHKTEYLMASCVHPDVIAKLKDYKLRLWHLYNGDGSEVIAEWEPTALFIAGGGSVGLRVLPLFYVMGYRRFIIHGMDCSYRDGESHAGPHTGKKVQSVRVRCSDGREFDTSPVMVTYKRFFNEMRQAHMGDANTDPTKIEVILMGDGLLQHWLKVMGGATPVLETPQEEKAA